MHRSFISMTWTPGVDEEDAQVMIRAIEDIYTLVRRHFGKPGQFDPLPTVRVFGSWIIPNMPQDAPYSNIDWYIQRSLDSSNQAISGSRFQETVVLEPWQATSPHFDFAMTDLDVTDDLQDEREIPAPEGRDSVLGVTSPGLFSLVSTRQFDDIESPELRKLALRHMVAHYFGMLLGVPTRRREGDTIVHQGRRYCANTCSMRYTDTTTLAVSFAQQELASGMIYCDACQKDLAAQIAGFHYGMN